MLCVLDLEGGVGGISGFQVTPVLSRVFWVTRPAPSLACTPVRSDDGPRLPESRGRARMSRGRCCPGACREGAASAPLAPGSCLGPAPPAASAAHLPLLLVLPEEQAPGQPAQPGTAGSQAAPEGAVPGSRWDPLSHTPPSTHPGRRVRDKQLLGGGGCVTPRPALAVPPGSPDDGTHACASSSLRGPGRGRAECSLLGSRSVSPEPRIWEWGRGEASTSALWVPEK